jgi:hypothetical protein
MFSQPSAYLSKEYTSMCAFQGKPVHLQWNSLWEGAIAHLFLSQHLTKIKNDYKIEDKQLTVNK